MIWLSSSLAREDADLFPGPVLVFLRGLVSRSESDSGREEESVSTARLRSRRFEVEEDIVWNGIGEVKREEIRKKENGKMGKVF